MTDLQILQARINFFAMQRKKQSHWRCIPMQMPIFVACNSIVAACLCKSYASGMYQSFDDTADPSLSPPRVARLREALKSRGLDGFLVPRADEHQGEYVPPSAERLAYISGFTGSAGLAIILIGEAALFVDGRYTVQAVEQTDPETFEAVHIADTQPHKWLKARLNDGMRIGYDPMLHTVSQVRRYEKACAAAGASFVACETNPLDAIWTDRPEPPLGAVTLHGLEYAGEPAADKIDRLDATLATSEVDAAVLTQPDSIAWLFNIRGSDVAHTPLPLSFAILRRGGRPQLFIDGRKLSNTVRDALTELTDLHEPGELMASLERLGAAKTRVLVDPDLAGVAIHRQIADSGGTVVEGRDPVLLPKARKNSTEIRGARTAHLRDGAALSRFLAWLHKHAGSGTLDEITAAEKLEAFRLESGALKELSFDSISAAGPHSAIPHYRVSRSSNLRLEPGSLYLIDSGGQYADGTTDVTRTIAIGTPTDEMRDRFTRVLKGHIAITTARFPEKTTGAQLDALARIALWRAGLDFDHGTGHGVGSYLSVHEGPQRISKTGSAPLEAGMIVSNEPGYYKAGDYGIRIENLELVTAADDVPGGERPMHGFETLTLAPIDQTLVNSKLLSDEEINWLDSYHAWVFSEIGPQVDDETYRWLEKATRPIRDSD